MWLRVDTMREQQTPKQAAPTDNDTDRRTFFYRAAISIGALFAVRHASDLNNAKLPPRPQDDDRDCNAFRFGPEQTNEQRPSAPQEVVEKPLVGATELSANVVTLIKGFEKLELTAYICLGGACTIGYGHTRGVKKGDRLPSPEKAEQLLIKDMDIHRREVLRVFENIPLTQPQLDALTSASFNCGCLTSKNGLSGFARYARLEIPKLNQSSDPAERAETLHGIVRYLCQYNRASGEFSGGLLRRRLSEGRLMAGDQDPEVSPDEYKKLKNEAFDRLGTKSPKSAALVNSMVAQLFKKQLGE